MCVLLVPEKLVVKGFFPELGSILNGFSNLEKAKKLVGPEVVRSALKHLVAELLKGHVRPRLGFHVVLHACIIPRIRGLVQGKLQKSGKLVEKHDRHADTEEFENFEDCLHFLHACIIPRIGKNARGKKENSPENLTLMVPSRVSHRAIDPGTPIIFKSSQK